MGIAGIGLLEFTYDAGGVANGNEPGGDDLWRLAIKEMGRGELHEDGV